MLVKSKVLDAFLDVLLEAARVDWVMVCISIIIVLAILGTAVILLYRLMRGDEVNIFWVFRIKRDKIIQEQTEAFTSLNEDARKKTQIIKVLDQVTSEIAKLLVSKSQEEYLYTKEHIFRFILHSIAVVLTKQKSNNHRVAILVDDNNGYLKLHEGIGYSIDGRRNMRLEINDSAAGHTFLTGIPYNSGNVDSPGNRYKRHPKATKEIRSLMCVPIKCGKITLGVLSIDGQDEDSFSKDDEDYLTYFANALTSLMLIEYINEQREEGVPDDQTSDYREPQEQLTS